MKKRSARTGSSGPVGACCPKPWIRRAALALLSSWLIVTAHGTPLDDRYQEVFVALAALKAQTPRTEGWRKAHGVWLRARVRVVNELFRSGAPDRSLAELDAVEKEMIPGEDAQCRIEVIEARVTTLLREPDGWARARTLLDRAERTAATQYDAELPLLVLFERAQVASSCQQYEEALAALKRLRESPLLKNLDPARVRLLRVQASIYEAVTYHYMGQLTSAKDAAVAGLTELAKAGSDNNTITLEARLRANFAATCLRLGDTKEALQNLEIAMGPLAKQTNDRACAEALASSYLTRAAIRCTQNQAQSLGAKVVRSDLADAERLYEQCYGPNSSSLLPLLTTEGWAFLNLGDLDSASHALERGLSIAKANGLPSYLQISLLENLCRLRLRQHRTEDARSIAITMRDIWREYLPTVIAAGSESDRLSLLLQSAWVDSAMATRSDPPTEDETNGAAESIIGTYGVVFDSLLRDAALDSRLPRDQRLRHNESRARLAALTLQLPSNTGPGNADEVPALRRLLRDIEGRHNIDTDTAGRISQLQAALPKDAALVVFSPYRTMDGKSSERIAAAIVMPDKLQVLSLPVARDGVRNVADELNAKLAEHGSASAIAPHLQDLSTALWQPIEPLIGGARQLYLCLDAAMQRVPVTIWPHPRVTFLTSPQALLRKPQAATLPGSSATWLLINAGTQAVHFNEHLPFPYSITDELKDHSLPSLPGARKEIEALATDNPDRWAILRSNTTDGEPEESAFVESLIDPPAIIHFAGHAIVHDPGIESASAASSWWQGVEQPRALWCSSLVFPHPQPAEQIDDLGNDNFLFSAEIAGLDLTGTQLVTLSACETGAGISPKNEGQYSLARAFHTAGVRDVVSSTEALPDSPTVKLMLPFYRRINNGDDAAQALWEEQRKLITEDDPATLRAFGYFRLTRAWLPSSE